MNKKYPTLACLLLVICPALFAEPNANQLPEGGIISSGVASISADKNYPQLNINQSSQRAIINWQSFDIGERQLLIFINQTARLLLLTKLIAIIQVRFLDRFVLRVKLFCKILRVYILEKIHVLM